MPAGLQVFDALGNTIFDTTTVTARVLGAIELTAGGSGSVTNSELTSGTPFFMYVERVYVRAARNPNVSFSGSTMNWSLPSGGSGVQGLLYYGVRV